MTASFTVRAPGKLILCGEYAVIHGAPALVAAVTRHASCSVETMPGRLRVHALGEGPLEVLVDGGNVRVIRRRQTIDTQAALTEIHHEPDKRGHPSAL